MPNSPEALAVRAAPRVFPRAAVPLILLAAFCWLGPFLWPFDPSAVGTGPALAGPTWHNPVGTDVLGRDELARLMRGGAETLLVAVPAAAIAFALGTLYGAASGFAPALLARLLMRLLDALLALPSLVVLLCGAALLPLNEATVAGLIGVTGWPGLARLVRTEIVALRERDFIHATRQLGAGKLRILSAHVLPNMSALLAVNAIFLLGDSVLALSSLSFLGLGVPPPAASWGSMLQSGIGLLDLGAWWLILPPGFLIAGTLFAAAAAGNALLRSNTP